MFYAGLCENGSESPVVAVVSLLITGSHSAERLLKGEILEAGMNPWLLDPAGSCPVYYFSSVISQNPKELPRLYEGLFAEVHSYILHQGFTVENGISVASSEVGVQHLTRNGFVPIMGPKYLGKYCFMAINGLSARTGFWRKLFGSSPNGSSANNAILTEKGLKEQLSGAV